MMSIEDYNGVTTPTLAFEQPGGGYELVPVEDILAYLDGTGDLPDHIIKHIIHDYIANLAETWAEAAAEHITADGPLN